MWQGRAAENAASRMLGFVGVHAAIDAALAELRQKVQEETDVFKANLMRVSVQKCSGSRRA